MRERVQKAAADLAYTAPSQRVRLVGVLAFNPAGWFFANMITALERSLSASGYTTALINLGETVSRERFFAETLTSSHLHGVILVASTLSADEVDQVRKSGIPIVVVGGGTSNAPRAGIDDIAGGRMAVEHLIGFRHRDIGMIVLDSTEDAAFDSGHLRRAGALAALSAAGIEARPEWIIETESTARGGAAAAEELLSRPKLPTALFVMSDEMATGALWTLRRAGIDVPGQISVIGFDDHDIAECVDLTTIRQSVPDQARTAAEMLIAQLSQAAPNGTDAESRAVSSNLPIRLVIRGTTGPLR